MSQFSITDDDPERVVALLTFMLSVSVDGPRRVLQPAVAQAMTLQSTAHGFAFDSVFQFVRGILGVFHTLKVCVHTLGHAVFPSTLRADLERAGKLNRPILGSVACRWPRQLFAAAIHHADR